MFHQVVQRAAIVRQQHNGHVDVGVFELLRELDRMHVVEVQRRNDQVETLFSEDAGNRLLATRHTFDARGVEEIQTHVFVEQGFVQPTVLRQDERVVHARNEKNVVDFVTDEILETLEAVSVAVFEIDEVVVFHKYHRGPAARSGPPHILIIENGVKMFHSVFP